MSETNVACLYRVSTASQLTDNDIPMQKKACRAFIDRQKGWRIVAEYTERGVSAYHKSETERAVLTQLKQDAKNKRFEILLVYMFDRLGRRGDETPFMAHWLHAQGVSLWSVTEGPQCFEEYADRLINYIRYWQSESESVNTSFRVAEKHRQLVTDGKFRGGPPAYGYRLEASSETGPRGRMRKKLVIDDKESAVVRSIYKQALEENCGCYTIARCLNEQTIRTRHGHVWTAPAVSSILRNPIYKGDYVSGKTINLRGRKLKTRHDQWVHSREPVRQWIIINEEEWAAVNRKMDGRRTGKPDTPHKISIKSPVEDRLLAGLVFCGYCGARLSSGKKRYDCPRKSRLDECVGMFGFGRVKLEKTVWQAVLPMITALASIGEEGRFALDIASGLVTEIKRLEKQLAALDKEKASLQESIVRYIKASDRGASDTESSDRGASPRHRGLSTEAILPCADNGSPTQAHPSAAYLIGRLTETKQTVILTQMKKQSMEKALCDFRNPAKAYLPLKAFLDNLPETAKRILIKTVVERVEAYRGRTVIKVKLRVNPKLVSGYAPTHGSELG